MPYYFRQPDNPYNSGEPGAGLWFDAATNAISLEYDLKNRGVLIALAPNTAGATSATHWWFDWETKGLWKIKFGSVNQEPFCLHARRNFVASSAAHSTVMQGGRNGYIYRFENTADDDDGNAFDSYVWFGPFSDLSMFSESVITELVGALARKSGKVRWDVFVGDTPEEAFNADPRESGIWEAGRNYTTHPRTRGVYQYIQLSGVDGDAWGFEQAYVILQRAGRARP